MLRTITSSLERILVPALTAGAVAFFLLSAVKKSPPEAPTRQSLNRLKHRLIGQGKSQIEKLLGKPRTIAPGPGTIWYYAVDARQHLAMAIHFRHDRVARVEFFHPPTMQDMNALQVAR
jgi:outer membrane protein assembly factor BamE (lipoprotein component of BamABCDE complex)